MLEIHLANRSLAEQATKAQLDRILRQYDLSPLTFTREIRIEDNVIPHSHPVLTLNSADKSDDELLASFIHEQMHWYVSSKKELLFQAVDALRDIFDQLPTEQEKVAQSEFSTYSHLIVNTLEYEGLIRYLGRDRATHIIMEKPYYVWIYAQVLTQQDTIKSIMKRFDLLLPEAGE